jgi:hypothetical protein
MNAFIQKNHRFLFYSSWIVLGIIQSRFTQLLDDEAYYWVYSKFLDWGYFDHPPMIAVLIKIGYAVFHNELGVRLLLLLMNVLSLMIIENLLEKKNAFLFYAIALSLAVLQLSGFVAVPDTPLIFFTALFFLVYKRFLHNAGWLNSFLLGVVAAALLYSKYHAVLIIFFVLLSNPKLFIRYQIYLAGFVALLLFTPHLWWQWQHHWISFRYHLFESNINRYRFSFTLEYVLGQILLAGPIAGIILLPASFLYRTKDLFEKSLKFTLIGIYLFFFLSSFRGKVEGNWTSPALIPLIVIGHCFLLERNIWKNWLYRLLPLTFVFVLFTRIVMIVDVIPVKDFREKYHGWRHWPEQMKQITKGLPVVFTNSYQRASKYWFYTGQITYSPNLYRERRNNFNFWPIEDSFLGKPVFVLDVYNRDSFPNKIFTPIDTVAYKFEPDWGSFAKVQFTPDQREYHVVQNRSCSIQITPQLSKQYYDYIMDHPGMDIRIVAGVFDKYGWIEDLKISNSLYELIQGPHQISLTPEVKAGKYYIIISILHVGTITPTHNSEKIPLEVIISSWK